MEPRQRIVPPRPNQLHLFQLRHRCPKRLRLIANSSRGSNRLSRRHSRLSRRSNRLSRQRPRRVITIAWRGHQERSNAKDWRENESSLSAIELAWKKCTRSTASRARLTKRAKRSTEAKSKNIEAQSMPIEHRKVILKAGFNLIDRGNVDA
jgi:hypothetical protein